MTTFMKSYDTLSQAIDGLVGEGYTEDFNLKDSALECRSGQLRLKADDFKVDKFYRFEGDSNPDDESVVYAISSDAFGIKGILVNAFGIYSETASDKLMQKLQIER
jgi:hypothetical protein